MASKFVRNCVVAAMAFTSVGEPSWAASKQVWYLRLAGGGFTNVPIGYKTRATCETVRRDIVSRYRVKGVAIKSSCKTK